MRSLVSVALALALLMTIGAASVSAGAPDHITISGSDAVDDFCGTGQTVTVSFRGVFNSWDDKAFGHVANTWTNPLNGATVIESFSGGGKFRIVDDGNGAYTIVSERQGMPVQIHLANGRLLLRDAGYIAFHDHFDAEDNYLGTDVVVHGPHPDFESGFELWCEVMVAALGL